MANLIIPDGHGNIRPSQAIGTGLATRGATSGYAGWISPDVGPNIIWKQPTADLAGYWKSDGSHNTSISATVPSTDVTGLGTLAALNAAPAGTLTGTVLNATVVTSSLTALGVQVSNLDMGSHRIVGLADPQSAQDASTKAYVDAVAYGMDPKASCRVKSTANVNISNPGTAVFDGVTLSNGDRILLASQSTASQNGIYVFNGSGSAMTRATDADSSAEVTSGMFTFVSQGTLNNGTGWSLTTADPIVLDTTSLTFTQVSGPGTYTATGGVTLTGTQFSITALGITNAMIANTTIDLTAKVTGILPSANGGTGNGFTKFSGPSASEKTFTLPNASATVLTDNAVVTVAQGGIGVGTLAINGVLYGNTLAAVQALAVNSSATNKFLTQSSSAAPAWAAIVAGDLPGSFSGFANPTNPGVNITGSNGSATTAMRSDAILILDQSIAFTWTGVHINAPVARTSGSAPYWSVRTPADTTLAASTESIGIQHGGNSSAATVTRQFATGAYAGSQRENLFVAPTYNTVGSSSWAGATLATLAIGGPPVVGGNITGSPTTVSLWVQTGKAQFSGGYNSDTMTSITGSVQLMSWNNVAGLLTIGGTTVTIGTNTISQASGSNTFTVGASGASAVLLVKGYAQASGTGGGWTLSGIANQTSPGAGGACSIAGSNGVGADQAGGTITVTPSLSTGAATPAPIKFQGTAVLGSSSTLQTASDVLEITNATTITIPANATTLAATGTGANGLKLKNLKNSANTGVSGTVKTVEIDLGGTPYYFLVSPTSTP